MSSGDDNSINSGSGDLEQSIEGSSEWIFTVKCTTLEGH